MNLTKQCSGQAADCGVMSIKGVVVNFGRILILTLVALPSFLAGVLYENIADFDKLLGPLAICMSALFATTVAVTNIRQSKHNELVKRTLDILDKKPELTKELTYFRNRINHRIHTMKLYEKPISKESLHPAITSLKTGESNIARIWLTYLSHLYIGIQEGIYDSKIIEKNIGSLPINVWRDFWPIAKWQELHLQSVNEGIFVANDSEYKAVEEWVKLLSNGVDLTREKPKYCYYPLDEDTHNKPLKQYK